jgi:hypothetical protein
MLQHSQSAALHDRRCCWAGTHTTPVTRQVAVSSHKFPLFWFCSPQSPRSSFTPRSTRRVTHRASCLCQLWQGGCCDAFILSVPECGVCHKLVVACGRHGAVRCADTYAAPLDCVCLAHSTRVVTTAGDVVVLLTRLTLWVSSCSRRTQANSDDRSTANYIRQHNNTVGNWLKKAGYYTAFFGKQVLSILFFLLCRCCRSGVDSVPNQTS